MDAIFSGTIKDYLNCHISSWSHNSNYCGNGSLPKLVRILLLRSVPIKMLYILLLFKKNWYPIPKSQPSPRRHLHERYGISSDRSCSLSKYVNNPHFCVTHTSDHPRPLQPSMASEDIFWPQKLGFWTKFTMWTKFKGTLISQISWLLRILTFVQPIPPISVTIVIHWLALHASKNRL